MWGKVFLQLILFLDGWRYNPGGFDQVFQPLSQVCTKADATGAASWSNDRDD